MKMKYTLYINLKLKLQKEHDTQKRTLLATKIQFLKIGFNRYPEAKENLHTLSK